LFSTAVAAAAALVETARAAQQATDQKTARFDSSGKGAARQRRLFKPPSLSDAGTWPASPQRPSQS
jgi:poly(3-hydroxybutyrate) depolymerase